MQVFVVPFSSISLLFVRSSHALRATAAPRVVVEAINPLRPCSFPVFAPINRRSSYTVHGGQREYFDFELLFDPFPGGIKLHL